MTANSSYSSKKGFTLIELMITITIIAVLATVGLVVFSTVQKNARASKRIQDLDSIKKALENYKLSTGGYPVQATFDCVGAAIVALAPAHMPAIPADPLDGANAQGSHCYQYRGTANEYKVRTNLTISTEGETSATGFAAQPNYIDPMRDGAADCAVTTIVNQTTPAHTGWAVYSTLGYSLTTPNACAY